METNSVTTAGGAAATASSGNSGAASSAVISSDFETFLKMLTAQMENQDPLNPVDSADYATQLATFSSVEQQVLTNDLLVALTQQLGGDRFQSMASWIGRETLAEAPVYFTGNTVALRPEYSTGADRAELVVSDSSGAEVQRFGLDMSESLVAWSGMDETGALLPAGLYSFAIESYDGETLLSERAASVYNPIVEVRQENGAILLTLSDGSELNASQATALR